MWEQIRVNKRNSLILLAVMAAVLVGLGFVIGVAVGGREGGLGGAAIAVVVWLVLLVVSFAGGDQLLLASSRAVPVTHDVHPQLFNVVEEVSIAAGLKKPPNIYIINDPAPNAFATGRGPQSSSVAVTAGLLTMLNRDELQGVMAHEVSHIVHRDILFVTLAGVMLGTIVLLSEVFMRGMFRASMYGGRRYSSRSRNNNGAQLVLIVIAILAAILAPIFAQILYFALSRRREYLADAGAVRLTRYPDGLAGALEKISRYDGSVEAANKVTAPMYITNPFRGGAASMFSTHPPVEERIRVLRNMSHGASWRDYDAAWRQTTGRRSIIPQSALKDAEEVGLREAGAAVAAPAAGRPAQAHQLGDLMRTVNGFAFLACPCGVKLKVPPNYKGRQVGCPRCGRTLDVAKEG